jgi:hypothetical protein
MRNLFTVEGQPKTDGEEGERSAKLAEVVRAIDPDILGVVEGPDTAGFFTPSFSVTVAQPEPTCLLRCKNWNFFLDIDRQIWGKFSLGWLTDPQLQWICS